GGGYVRFLRWLPGCSQSGSGQMSPIIDRSALRLDCRLALGVDQWPTACTRPHRCSQDFVRGRQHLLTRVRHDQVKRTEMPPSTSMAAPVMKLELSESRNRAASAVSLAAAIRLIGCRPVMKASPSGFPSPPAGVTVPPGS